MSYNPPTGPKYYELVGPPPKSPMCCESMVVMVIPELNVP